MSRDDATPDDDAERVHALCSSGETMSFQAEKRLENFFDGPCRFCLHVRRTCVEWVHKSRLRRKGWMRQWRSEQRSALRTWRLANPSHTSRLVPKTRCGLRAV